MIGTGTERTGPDRPPWLPPVAGWCFVLCAAVAVGHGLWAVVGTGEPVVNFDVRPDGPVAEAAAGDCPVYGPFVLDPRLNPYRAVLRTGFAPVGGERYDYEASLVGEGGEVLWERRGVLGSRSDEASFVRAQSNLMEFEVDHAGRYSLLLRFADGSLDDLREATLDLRGGIVRVNPRITWGFGLAAVAFLVIHLLASRRAAAAWEPAEESEDYREAA